MGRRDDGLKIGVFEVNDRTLPHVHDIIGQLFEPSRRNGPLLIEVLWDAALFTAKEAAVGFVLGAVFGFAIGVALAHSRLLLRGFMPYIVASQTIPILAIAPMVVIWLGGRGLPDWFSVSIIAAYLTSSRSRSTRSAACTRSTPRARADALLRRERLARPLEAPRAGLAAVPLRRAEDQRHRGDRRRDHRRAARPRSSRGSAGRSSTSTSTTRRRPRASGRRTSWPRCSGSPSSSSSSRSSGSSSTARRSTWHEPPAWSSRSRASRSSSAKGGVVALENVSLDVRPRDFVSLIGPSGCGKSTLLRVIGDLIQPTSGTVVVNGKSAEQARRDRDYGIVFQDAVLYDWRTVAKNIALPLEMAGWDRGKRGGARERDARPRRAVRLRRPPSLAALGRHAAARLDRAGALVLAAAPAHGRAVRRARRDDPRAAERRAAADLGRHRLHDRLRHALDRRGRLPLDPGRRDVAAARPDRRRDRRSTCRSRARSPRARSRATRS